MEILEVACSTYIVRDVELWLRMLATSWRVLVGDVAVVGDGKNWKLAGKEPLGQPWPERAGSVHCNQV